MVKESSDLIYRCLCYSIQFSNFKFLQQQHMKQNRQNYNKQYILVAILLFKLQTLILCF